MRHEHNNNDAIFQQKGSRYGLIRWKQNATIRRAEKTKIQSNACTCTPNGKYIFKYNVTSK